MWSPTKLDFLFYDFSVIYYDFFKDSAKINKKRKGEATVTVANIVTVAAPSSKTAQGVK